MLISVIALSETNTSYKPTKLLEGINKVSKDSGNLIFSGAIIGCTFGYCFLHPADLREMLPIIGLIVGHFFGRESGKQEMTIIDRGKNGERQQKRMNDTNNTNINAG